MRNQLIKGVMGFVCLTLLAIPLTAQKGGHGGSGGGSTACAVVATPVLSTTTASGGINVGVFSRVGNCSSGKKRFTVTVSAMSSCGEETVIASPVISFEGGQYKLISTTYTVAPDTCPGTSEVMVRVYSGGTMLAGDSAMLTIQ
jgi:hypothetical protein